MNQRLALQIEINDSNFGLKIFVQTLEIAFPNISVIRADYEEDCDDETEKALHCAD